MQRRLPRVDPFNTLPVPVGGRHQVAVIEQECPGCFEISCSCGEQTWTPWSEAHAQEIAAMHLWVVGAPTTVVIDLR